VPTQKSPDRRSKRRSTRVAAGVFLRVRGVDANGQPFMEDTGTLEVSFQGCRYFSRHALAANTWLTIEITNQDGSSKSPQFRARVAWARKSRNIREMFQVGVEFETPGNIWTLANPPADWRHADAPRRVVDEAVFEREMKELVGLAETGTYYQLLGVTSDSPRDQVRHRYYEFVRRFHPDLHMDHAEWMQPLQKLMETVTLAYKTLTDETARQKYDERLAASYAYRLGRNNSESQKTAQECGERARECLKARNRGGAILWLRKAVEIEPESAAYQALLARALSAVVSLRREAGEHFEKAIALDPYNAAVCFQAAELYEEMKLPWRARPHYEKVLDVDACNAKALERLSLLGAEPGRDGAAKRSFVKRIFGRSIK
jgi:hypothetical protein